MNILKIEKKKGTPEVILNNETDVFEITGESYPENPAEFYNPIIKWISDYCKDKSRKLTLNINLTYFNSSSSKALLDIFDILEEYHLRKGVLTVNWYYHHGDESTKDNGEEFAEDLNFPFNIVEIKN